MIIGKQLFLGKIFDRNKIAPICNLVQHSKCNGGVWTSSFVRGKSDWLRWITSESYPEPLVNVKGTILTPKQSARVLVFQRLEDLRNLEEQYKIQCSYPLFDEEGLNFYFNFEELSKDYDAVHFNKFNKEFLDGHIQPFKIWDVESTIWFRDVFEENYEPFEYSELTGRMSLF